MKIPEVFRFEVENSVRNLSQLLEQFAQQKLDVARMQTISKCQGRWNGNRTGP